MGLFDFFDDRDKMENRESWDQGPVSERHFGKDRFGYHHDEEDMYDADERFDSDDQW